MSTMNVTQAAKATGMHRVTLQKHIKQGKLSVTRDREGKPQIDVAELLRVYGPLKGDGNTDSTHQATLEQQQTTAALVDNLKQQLEAAQEREKWLQAQLNREQARYEELERKMLPAGTDETTKKGFLARIFGK